MTRLPWTFPAPAAAPRAAGHGTTASSAPMTTTTSASIRSGRGRKDLDSSFIYSYTSWVIIIIKFHLKIEFHYFNYGWVTEIWVFLLCVPGKFNIKYESRSEVVTLLGRVTASGQSLTWFCSVALQGPDFMQTLMLQIGDMRLCHQLQASEIQGCYDNCDDNSTIHNNYKLIW